MKTGERGRRGGGERGKTGPPTSESKFDGSLSSLLTRQVVPGSLQPHGLQCTRLPGPSPPPGACSNSGPLRRSFPVSPCGVQAVGLMPSDWVISRTEVLVYISKVVVDFRVFIHSVYLLGPSVMVTSMLRMIPGASVHGIL